MARSINFLNKTESPIEQILGLCLRHLVVINSEWMNGFAVLPQEELELDGKKIRLDFLIINPSSPNGSKFVVECDGHEFHEKTKEQAQKDKKRDRVLVKHGYTVFHFTGSEIVRDPLKCSMEVIDTIWGSKSEKKVD